MELAGNDNTPPSRIELEGEAITLLECLGQGTTGTVHRGLWQGRAVAVKRLRHPLTGENATRFAREQQVAMALNHDNLVRMFGSGSTEDGPFVVLEFVNGWSLDDLIKSGERVPQAVAVAMTHQLLSGLAHAHSREVIHRDVKPANVLVDRTGNLKLADFSLAKQVNATALSHTGIAQGTPIYMSPEQWRGNTAVDSRADIYGVGAFLYTLLAGAPPFVGESIPQLAFLVMTQEPKPIASLVPGISPTLATVVDRALCKDPERRFATADAMRGELGPLAEAREQHDIVRRWLQAKMQQRSLHDSSLELTAGLKIAPLVGRDRELQWCLERLAKMQHGDQQVAFVEACSGIGKTRLLDALAQEGERRGMRVFRGCGVPNPQLALHSLQGVIKELRCLGREQPDLMDRIGESLGEARELVAIIVPEFAKETAHDAAQSWGRLPREQGVAAVQCLLEHLGAALGPTLVVIDDCQWAGNEVAEALRRWAWRLTQEPARGPIMVVAAWRLSDPDAPTPLSDLGFDSTLRLDPLPNPVIRQLLHAMSAGLPEVAIDRAERLAAGNPLIASSVIANLISAGALTKEDGRWTLCSDIPPDTQLMTRPGETLGDPLAALHPEARELLSAGAVLGLRFCPRRSARLCALDPRSIDRLMQAAVRRRIVARDGYEFVFVHEQLRESLLCERDVDELRRLHLAAARDYQRMAPEMYAAIANHLHEAGAHDEAYPAALMAAKNAVLQGAMDEAESHYRIARAGLHHAPLEAKVEIWEGLSQVLMARGGSDECDQLLESALALAPDALVRARLLGRQANLAMHRGRPRDARHLCKQALALLGAPVSAPTFALRQPYTWRDRVRGTHSPLARWLTKAKNPDPTASELLVIRLRSCLTASELLCPSHGSTASADLQLRLLKRSQGRLSESDKAHIDALQDLVTATRTIPTRWWHPRTSHIAMPTPQDGVAGDTAEAAEAAIVRAVTLTCTGHYVGALELFARNPRCPDPSLQRLSALYEGRTQIALGHLRDAYATGASLWRTCQIAGDLPGMGHALELLLVSRESSLDPSMEQALLDETPETGLVMLIPRVLRALEREDHNEVVQLIDNGLAAKVVRPDAWTGVLYIYLARALRSRHPVVTTRSPVQAKTLRRRWCQILSTVRDLGALYPMLRPLALHELGYDAAWRGKSAHARALLDEAVLVAQQQDAHLHVAHGRLVRADVGLALNWADAKADLEAASAAYEALGAHYWMTRIDALKTGQ